MQTSFQKACSCNNTLLNKISAVSIPRKKFQTVSFGIVKKSEGTSRECQQNLPTCSQLVKSQGFYIYVYHWLLAICTLICKFHLLLPLCNALKPCFLDGKSIGFSMQKMMFGVLKAILLQLKTYVFGKSSLFFVQIKENLSLD